MGLAQAYEYTARVMVENMMARDAEEGIGAFIEKRDPVWTGEMNHDPLRQCLYRRHPERGAHDRHRRRLGQRRAGRASSSTKYLIDKGFVVFPVNPSQAGKTLLGRMTYASLAEVPGPIDMVDIFRASDAVPAIVEEAMALDPLPKVIWMQLTVRNDEAARQGRGARHQGGDEPLPEDRIWAPFGRDRLERRQFARAVLQASRSCGRRSRASASRQR